MLQESVKHTGSSKKGMAYPERFAIYPGATNTGIKNESCTGATKGTKEGEQMAKIRISYETPEELEKVKKLLLPVIKSCKMSKNSSGPYKKAYIETSKR